MLAWRTHREWNNNDDTNNRYFEIQTDHLISARQLDLLIVNKKKKKENLPNSGFCLSGWPQVKTGEKSDKYLDLARELKKL